MTETFAEKKCTPCRGGIPPLTDAEAERFQSQTPNWELRDGAHRIERTFRFSNRADRMAHSLGQTNLFSFRIRRRCRVIVCVDAEADPEMRFSSFIALQRYAWIDMAIDIRMPYERIQARTIECMGYDPLGKTYPKLL
jgi:hypothetical protein